MMETASPGQYTAQRVGESALPQLLPPRPMRPDELADVRATWWSHAAMGHPLRAEPGVIVIDGGRR
jgi:hypothetical protein